MQRTSAAVDPPDFLTTRQVCATIGISRDTLQRLVRDGHLDRYELPSGNPRYRRDDVLGLLRRVDPTAAAG